MNIYTFFKKSLTVRFQIFLFVCVHISLIYIIFLCTSYVPKPGTATSQLVIFKVPQKTGLNFRGYDKTEI